MQTGFDKADRRGDLRGASKLDLAPIPYIVVIIDEMADLMMVAGKDIEGAVQRLAQMARAAGIHVIMATQRPVGGRHHRHDQGEFPDSYLLPGPRQRSTAARSSANMGAEQLLGHGRHALYGRRRRISRVHGPFVSDEEVEKVVRHLKTQGQPEYLEAVTAEEPTEEDGAVFDATGMGQRRWPWRPVLAGGCNRQTRPQGLDFLHSAPAADRYNRAASLMERMETRRHRRPGEPCRQARNSG